jgi:hypothetical protein
MILWEGKGFNNKKAVCICTGIDKPSKNAKTGEMVQAYLFGAGRDPVNQKKKPHVVCNKCPLINAGCYVNLGRSVRNIYNKYKAGGYPKITDFSVFAGKSIRYGAYGEGILLGLPLIKNINKIAKGWTAYTHNWHLKKYQGFRKYFMASVESLADAKKAWSNGWRTFRIVRSVEEKTINEVICPATPYYKEKTGKTVQCIDCMLCCGMSSKSPKSIVIVAHGPAFKLSSINKYLEETNEGIV